MAQHPAPPSTLSDPLRRARRPPDRQGDRPRLRPGPQAGQPVPADRPVRRRPPRHPRPRPVRRRHAPAVVRDPAGQRPAAGPAPGVGRRQLPRDDPDDEPADRPQPRATRSAPRTRSPRRSWASRGTRLLDGIGARGAGRGRQLRRGGRVEVELELELAADAADIFEVRGWVRPERGRHLPIAMRPDRVTFRYDGLDDVRRATHIAFASRATRPVPVDPDVAGSPNAGWVRLAWHWELGSGEARELRWLAWTTERDAPEPTDGSSPVAQGRAGRTDPDAVLFPTAPQVDEDAVAGSYRAWNRGFAEIRTDNELFNLAIDPIRRRPAPAASTTARARTSGTSPPASRGSRRCSGGTRSSPRSRRSRSGRSSRSRRSRSLAKLPGRRRGPGTRRGAGQDPPRAAHGRDGDAPARLPHTPYYGTVDATPLWLVLLGATFDWTGDRALVDRLWPNALRGAGVDRPLRRPRRRRVRGVRAADRPRAAQPGLEGLVTTRSATGTGGSPTPRSRSPRSRATCSTPSGGWRRWPASAARASSRPASTPRPSSCAPRFEEAFWVDDLGFYAMALDGDKRPADAIGSQRGPLPVERDRVAGAGPAAVVERLHGARHVLGLGDPDLRLGPDRLQPDRLPHGHGLAARRVADRRRASSATASRTRPTGCAAGCSRRASTSRTSACPSCSAASTARSRRSRSRTRSRARRRRGPRARSFLFLETMLGLRPHAHRPASWSSRRPELPEWLAKVTITNLRVGEGSVDLLFHRWRGGTSAEVIRKSPDLDVTIRM